MENIAMIVNSEDMMRIAAEAIEESREELRLVATQTYEESYELGKRLEADGCRLLIARGGHARRLRDSGIGIPIVSIPFTGNNITAILLQATREWGEFAVVGNNILVQMARELEKAIEAKIHFCTINHWTDFEVHLTRFRELGIRAVVGGYDASRFAEKLGLHTYCVTTSKYEISAAIADAKDLLAAMDREKHWSNLLCTVLDTIREGVVITDADRKITHMNRPAKKLMKDVIIGSEVKDPLHRKRINHALKTGESIYDELTEDNDYKYTNTIIPIHSGDAITETVIVMQEVEYVRKIEQKVRQQMSQKGLVATKTFSNIRGDSAVMRETIQKAKRFALVNSTVLITGESGTGKEIFAQSIHNFSMRHNGAFVAINCATIPSALLESELFGYVDGAFTGAKRGGKMGLFELAHDGTIFLDEIGEISLDMQARLLRVLEERQIMRIGDNRVIPVNIRIIAATNKDLGRMVEEGSFRSDFYYRLNVLSLNLRPLRERPEDLYALLDTFIEVYAHEHNRNQIQFTDEGMQTLLGYSWPGNARELKNVVERLIVTCPTGVVDAREACEAIGVSEFNQPPVTSGSTGLISTKEQELIESVLRETGGNKSEAAKRLGISRATLHRRLRKTDGD